MVAGEIGAPKAPTVWKFVEDKDMPKTNTGKYVRLGLAAHLGIEESVEKAPEVSVRPATVSASLSGLRFVMGVGIMFNHIASATEDEYSYGPVFGKFKSSTFFFPHNNFLRARWVHIMPVPIA